MRIYKQSKSYSCGAAALRMALSAWGKYVSEKKWKRDKKYHEEIDLPAEVDTKDFRKTFNNNVLEIKLEKVKLVVSRDG